MSWRNALARFGDAILDPTIVASFGRGGFNRHRTGFDPTDLEVDLSGRVCAITGANGGLGYATASALAQRGATVWLLCRNAGRGEHALAALRRETKNSDVHLAIVDVSSLADITRFVESGALPRLDVLVNNAGILPAARAVTADGIESTLATNLVGPFALTAGLLPALSAGERARIIWVSSGGMYPRKHNLARLWTPASPFDGVTAYADTKRAMVMTSARMATALSNRGIAVHCMHPGWADTPGVRSSIPGFWRATRHMLRTPPEGADTIIWLAATEHAQTQSGLFWFDRAARRTHFAPWTHVTAAAQDALWRALHDWAAIRQGTFDVTAASSEDRSRPE